MRLLAELPRFDLARFDRLPHYTRALAHSHVLYLTAARPHDRVLELAPRARQLRNLLHNDAAVLAAHGILDGRRLRQLRRTPHHRIVAFDLVALAGVLRSHWPDIATRTAVTDSQLMEAELLGAELIEALGKRGDDQLFKHASLRRDQTFTLFMGVYGQARRAVQYVRYEEGDADVKAPTAHGGKNRKAKEGGSEG